MSASNGNKTVENNFDASETKQASNAPTEIQKPKSNARLFVQTEKDDYGYNFYPERQKSSTGEVTSFWEQAMKGRGSGRHFNCQSNILWCANNHPLVKLMIGALKSRGCEVNLRRHTACENCIGGVSGGFDPKAKQVVICQNTSRSKTVCCNILAHEFIHAFDYCRAKLDFSNLHHLACTEIRAANIMHCSILAAWAERETGLIDIKEKHKVCVKNKAVMSIVTVRNVSREKAREIVEEVFPKCYNDLEPVGRRPWKNARSQARALEEGPLYGYSNQ